MARSVRFLFCFAFSFLFVAVSGCNSPIGPTRSVVLRVSGSVVSSVGNGAIPGASITLGSGGHFSLPGTIATTQADAGGGYSIQAALTYRETCPFIWVTAAAVGYVTSSREDSRHTVACNGDQQNITITLKPN